MREGPIRVAMAALLLISLSGCANVPGSGSKPSRATGPAAVRSTQPSQPAQPSPTPQPSPTATPIPTPSLSPSASASGPAPNQPGGPAGGGSSSPAPPVDRSKIWHPRPGTSWQWQITGTVDPTLAVQMFDIDLFEAQSASSYSVPGFGTVNVPQGANPGVIGQLHSRGRVVICYVDTGAWEDYRPDAALFPKAVIGAQTKASTGAAWQGEHWLDIRQTSWSQFEALIVARLDLAQRSGCDGVEGDQNNSAANNPGFPTTLADQKAWYLELARLLHARGLSAGQKNGVDTTDAETVAAYDWNLNEECNHYNECGILNPFVAAGKAVFQVEYTEDGETASTFCPQDNAANFDGLLKHLDLGVWREACRGSGSVAPPPPGGGGTTPPAPSGGGCATGNATSTNGYDILTSAGGIYTFGSACYYGNLIDHGYPGPAVGFSTTPRGGGYSILNSAGGIYTFGDARYWGNLIDHHYPGPATAISMTPSGNGYAILTQGGGIYTFGDARYYGNLIDHGYPGAAVSVSYTPSGDGYAILTDSGALYTFGDARYWGNLLDHGYPGPAVGFAYVGTGDGYQILTGSGALYTFGNARYYGNLLDHGYPGPAVALADTP